MTTARHRTSNYRYFIGNGTIAEVSGNNQQPRRRRARRSHDHRSQHQDAGAQFLGRRDPLYQPGAHGKRRVVVLILDSVANFMRRHRYGC